MDAQTKNILKYLILPLIVASVLVFYFGRQEQRDWLMHVDFYDIGQGDSFLITTYEGNQVLVDGGPGDTVLQKLPNDLGLYDKTIEMVVLTHPHLDHFEGLIAVLKKYEVKKVLMPNVEYKSNDYLAFLEAVNNEGSQILYAMQGQRHYLDRGTVLDILYPTTNDVMKPGKSADINDTSIVAMLRFGRTRILLTGDSGKNIEDELLPKFDLDADVLKVGHHGSKHSTSKKFLDEVTPQYSVIQLGKNNYGHPAPETLSLLESVKTSIFRMDQIGDLEMVSDGSTVTVTR
jgi:competence protein ComEC